MQRSCFYLLTLTLPSISFIIFIKHFHVPQSGVKIKNFVTFSFHQEGLKTEEFSFQPANLLKIELLQTCFGRVFGNLRVFACLTKAYIGQTYTNKDTFTTLVKDIKLHSLLHITI